MSDLIRRSDAIEAIEETDWYHINRDGDLVSGARSDGTALYKAGDVYKALNAVPTIDAVEVVRGEWKDRSDGGRILYPWTESHECSQCESWGSSAWNYCPYCGAKMKGADDEID